MSLDSVPLPQELPQQSDGIVILLQHLKSHSLAAYNLALKNEDISSDDRPKRIRRLNFFGETLDDFDDEHNEEEMIEETPTPPATGYLSPDSIISPTKQKSKSRSNSTNVEISNKREEKDEANDEISLNDDVSDDIINPVNNSASTNPVSSSAEKKLI